MTSERLKGDFIAAVIDDPAELDAIQDDLVRAGVDKDSIRVFCGHVGRERIEKIDGKGWLGRLRRGVDDYLGNAHDLRVRHEEEVEKGNCVVLVNEPDHEKLDQVHQVLVDHHGRELVTRTGASYKSG